MERNGDVPLLPKSEAMYYYFQHAGWDVCETKLNLAQVNMHIDDKINEINENLDPKKWLDPQELEDWSPPSSKTRIFSKEELEFRERFGPIGFDYFMLCNVTILGRLGSFRIRRLCP